MVAEIQTAALHHPSVLRWIGCQGHPSPIPDHELLAITTVVNSGVPVASHAFVKFGERIRIRGGSLDGVQGVLVGNDDDRRLIVSVDILGQSIAVALHNYEFEQAA
jgi:transcription antitermination factor NusG